MSRPYNYAVETETFINYCKHIYKMNRRDKCFEIETLRLITVVILTSSADIYLIIYGKTPFGTSNLFVYVTVKLHPQSIAIDKYKYRGQTRMQINPGPNYFITY